MVDRAGLGAFLRHRRNALQPEDVGLARGRRRRTEGLRREEVAALRHLSTDYCARLERGVGPHPSEQMITSIAQGLHLTLDEGDRFFGPRRVLAGPPARQELWAPLRRMADARRLWEASEDLVRSRVG